MPEAVQSRLADSAIVFVVDEAIYTRGAILRALHWYSDQFTISTSTGPDATFVITMRELIVAKAFAEGDLLDDAPIGDWRDPVAQNSKS
jgi:hypothetical protein